MSSKVTQYYGQQNYNIILKEYQKGRKIFDTLLKQVNLKQVKYVSKHANFKNKPMKRYLLLILLIVVAAGQIGAQVASISGTTKFRTKVTYGPDAKTAKIPGGYAVDIIDANNYFFTIKYNDGNGYVVRNHIEYDPAELSALMKANNGGIELKEGEKIDLSRVEDRYKYEIDHIRYNLGRYHREMKSGYAFALLGVGAVASPSFIDFNDTSMEKTVKEVGYGLGILGGLLILDSNKWMKRIYFGPEGVGIKYSF